MTRAALILAFLPLIACEQPREITEPSAELSAIIEGQNQLAIDLMATIPEDGNLFYSPFSITSALGMTYAGAAGVTHQEMHDTLHIPVEDAVFHQEFGALSRDLAGDHNRPYTLLSGNRLWGQEGMTWKQAMLDTCAEHYDAPVTDLDFAGDTEGARKDINQWVSKMTEGMIDEALKSGDINSATRLVLSNAIYFHADWSEAFDEEFTSEGDFTLGDGGVVSAPLMHGTLPAGLYQDELLSVLRLPYEGDEISLLVFLPAEADGLDALELALTPSEIDGWVSSMDDGDVAITLPRFSMRSRFDLADTFSELGMPSAFDEQQADFSNMTEDASLYISKIIHEAVIELDEQGTTAAAFTGVVMTVSSFQETPEFTADHPFVFAIRDDLTGAILFMGRLADPSLQPSQG